MIDRRTFLASTAAVALAACSPSRGDGIATATIAGGDPGGTFVKLARLLAGRLEQTARVESVRVAASAGAAQNLQLLVDGVVDVAPAFADSVQARDSDDVVAIAKTHQTLLHCLVRRDSGITDLEQLAGRSVSIGQVGSGTSETARRLLDLAGIAETPPGAWLEQRTADGAIGVAGGAVDAMFWWGGRPAQEIAAVTSVAPLRALDLGAYVASADAVTGGVYEASRLPGEFYGQTDVTTLGVSCLLTCRRDTRAALVRAIVETVTADGSLLVPQPSNGLRYFSPGTLYDTAPIVLHREAERVFRRLHG